MKMAKMTRYSLYYRLMDVGFAAGALLLALEIAEYGFSMPLPEPLYTPLGLAMFFVSFVTATFCVFARFMRDDFAELLWQKAAGTVLKALFILPIPLAILIGLLVIQGNIDVPDADFSAPGISQSDGGAVIGIIYSFIYVWVFAPILFTFAFQWHRWRASR
jgi:hypothetical protein